MLIVIRQYLPPLWNMLLCFEKIDDYRICMRCNEVIGKYITRVSISNNSCVFIITSHIVHIYLPNLQIWSHQVMDDAMMEYIVLYIPFIIYIRCTYIIYKLFTMLLKLLYMKLDFILKFSSVSITRFIIIIYNKFNKVICIIKKIIYKHTQKKFLSFRKV